MSGERDESDAKKAAAAPEAAPAPETTEKIEPAMLMARVRLADAKAAEREREKEAKEAARAKEAELAETPRAPDVALAALRQAADEQAAKAPAMKPDAAPEDAPEHAREPAPESAVEAKPTPAPPPVKTETEEEASPRDRVVAWATAHADPLIGGGIALVYVVWLLATARGLGFSRDEGFYFSAAGSYEGWFKTLLSEPGHALQRATIDAAWTANHEHPSLMKSLFALSHMFLWSKWRLFDDQSTAFRFPGMLSMGLALFVTYLFATRVYSRRAGIMAAIALGLMPRIFYHAHLACFDVPIMAMWITCIYTYWCAEKNGGLGWALAAGLVYGLTLETKHNAWMMPAVFVPHALVMHGRSMAEDAAKKGRIAIPATLIAMATVGPVVFLFLWPWMWNDTLPRIQEYLNFHLHHEYYNIEFLGRTYFGPPSPRSYMPVMILATVPTVTLVLGAVGIVDRLRVVVLRAVAEVRETAARATRAAEAVTDRLHSDLLLLLALAVPLAVFLLPTTPIFGGTKHWIPAYPALAIFAGRGFDLVADRIELALRARTGLEADPRRWIVALAGGLAMVGPYAVTRHSHPFGLSSYVPFVGGTAGGADLGLNRQFWGFTTESLGPWFEQNTKPGDTVYIMDTSWPSWQRLVDEKRVPPWLRGVGSPAEAEISIVHHEQHINEVDYNIWTEYGSDAPEYVLTHDGVPIISVYRRSNGQAAQPHLRAPRRRN